MQNPSKADNLEPHILSITVGCPLWRGCIDVNGKTIGTQKFARYIEVSVIEGCPLGGVPLYFVSLGNDGGTGGGGERERGRREGGRECSSTISH